MESCMVLKIIGVSKYDGMSRNGKPYSLYTLELDFHGEKCKIKTFEVSAKYCYAAHESRLHQNDRCKRFTLCLVLTVCFRSLAPWGKLFQLFI